MGLENKVTLAPACPAMPVTNPFVLMKEPFETLLCSSRSADAKFGTRSGMNKSTVDGSRADRGGMLIAAICFVHCVAGPVILSVAGLASFIGISEKIEPAFLLCSITLGSATLIPGYRKRHGRISCLAMFLAGMLFLFVRRHIEWPSFHFEPIATACGAGLIIAAHVLNLRFSRRCQCCEPVESHADSAKGIKTKLLEFFR
jgi:hypothetical protein